MSDETETKAPPSSPEGWTVQDGPEPVTERSLADEPQQFTPEQLPDPAAAEAAGVPPIEIPENQISEDAASHPNGPEPWEAGAVVSPVEDDEAEDGEDNDIPSDSWTKAELQEYADASGIEIPSGATKAEMLEAIHATG